MIWCGIEKIESFLVLLSFPYNNDRVEQFTLLLQDFNFLVIAYEFCAFVQLMRVLTLMLLHFFEVLKLVRLNYFLLLGVDI